MAMALVGAASPPRFRPILKWAGGKTRLVPLILGRLPSRIGTYVEPFVGCLLGEAAFDLNSLEVARLLEAPLEYLMRPDSRIMIEREERGIRAKAAAYPWDGEMIWGATCIILAELVAVVREAI